MSHRITTRVEEWTETALEEQALNDRVTWDGAFAMTPEGPQMLMVFFMPGAVLGTTVQTVVVLQNVSVVTELDITETVRNVLERLRQERSNQVTGESQLPFPGLLTANGGQG